VSVSTEFAADVRVAGDDLTIERRGDRMTIRTCGPISVWSLRGGVWFCDSGTRPNVGLVAVQAALVAQGRTLL